MKIIFCTLHVRRSTQAISLAAGCLAAALPPEYRKSSVLIDSFPEQTDQESPLAGKTVVVTGTLQHFKRDEIKGLIKKLGGRAASSVSKKTDFVVAGDKAGSKLTKAEKLGILVMDEETFVVKLAANQPDDHE